MKTFLNSRVIIEVVTTFFFKLKSFSVLFVKDLEMTQPNLSPHVEPFFYICIDESEGFRSQSKVLSVVYQGLKY